MIPQGGGAKMEFESWRMCFNAAINGRGGCAQSAALCRVDGFVIAFTKRVVYLRFILCWDHKLYEGIIIIKGTEIWWREEKE